jgi:hypothetical protein
MPYAFIQDVPADENIYRQIRELLPTETPAGLLTHIAAKHDGGLRYIDVWETEAAWNAFRDSHLEPAVGKVLANQGIPHTHDAVTFAGLDVIDVWTGAAGEQAAQSRILR